MSVRSSVGLVSNATRGPERACAAKGEALVGELLPELAPRERFVAVAGAACHLEPLTFRLASNVASGSGHAPAVLSVEDAGVPGPCGPWLIAHPHRPARPQWRAGVPSVRAEPCALGERRLRMRVVH